MGRTFDKSVLVGVGLVVALLIVNAGLAYRNTRQLLEDAEWVAHTHEVLDLTGDVLRTLVDAETEERGFLITGKENFLEPYQQALARLDQQVQTLKDKTHDNPRQQSRITELEQLSAERLALLQKGLDLRRKNAEEARAFTATGQGKAKMDAVRRLIASMEEEEHNLLRDRERQSALAYRTTVATELIAAALGLALVGALVYLVRRSLNERSRAAALVHEQRERLHTTLTSIGDAVIVTDAEGRVTLMNGLAQAVTGWDDGAAGRPLGEVFRIVNEQTRQPVESPVTKVIREGVVVGLANHTALIARDGSEVPIDDSGAPIRNAGGEIIGVVLVFRDVTERRRLERMQKRAEESLRQSEAESRRLLEFHEAVMANMGEGLYAVDTQGLVTYMNPAAERFFGWTSAELLGRKMHDMTHYRHSDGRPFPIEECAGFRVLHQGEVLRDYDDVFIRKDGTFFPVVYSSSPLVSDGKLAGLVVVFRDVTQRKRAEEVLRQSEARKTAILDTALDCIITIDHEGKVVEFNPAAERTFGCRRADVLGREMAELMVPPPLRDKHRRGLAHYLATGAGPVLNQRIEMPALRADGTEFPVELAITPISAEGPPLFTAYLRDITARKRAEQASRFLADASKSLAALVDYSSTMQKVARLAVPSFADWCAVDLEEPDRSLRRVAVAHVDSSKVELAHALSRRYPPDPDAPHGVPHILRTGKPELIPEVTDALLAETVKDEELLRSLRELGLKSYLGVPLQARGKTVGAITFVAAESGRRFDATDLAVAEDLAHRAGIAMENARLYTEVQEADRRKDEFLAMLAHELRNPLAPIRNALHIMKQAGADGGVAQRVREMMERQVQAHDEDGR
jgi:PAS domain S-box-containing protein